MIHGVTFNRKASATSGLQPWCIECDRENKALDLEYAWVQFQNACTSDGTRDAWSRDEYVAMVGRNECHWCGGKLSAYGGGHHIDRLDNLRPHERDNCVAACAGCNMMRSDKHPEHWCGYIEGLLERYGRGRIPWHLLCQKKLSRPNIPNLSTYAIDTQTRLFPLGERDAGRRDGTILSAERRWLARGSR